MRIEGEGEVPETREMKVEVSGEVHRALWMVKLSSELDLKDIVDEALRDWLEANVEGSLVGEGE